MELLPQISRFSNRVKVAPPPPPMVLRPKFGIAPAAVAPAPAGPPLGLPTPVPLVTIPAPSDVLPLILNGVGRVPSSFISWAGVLANIPAAPPPAAGTGVLPTVSKTANYSVLATDSGTWFDNGGAPGTVVFTLPAPSPGLNFGFSVIAPHLLQVSASAGAAIAYGPGLSAPGGNVNSPFPSSAVTLYAPAGMSNQWVAQSATGGWNVN